MPNLKDRIFGFFMDDTKIKQRLYNPERDNMNALELAAQKIVISLLQDIEANHTEIINLCTLGKLDPARVEKINSDIIWSLKMLHPLFDVAHGLIPESMIALHKTMDWCQEIYHQVIEPINEPIDNK